jgi:hypothetical protein
MIGTSEAAALMAVDIIVQRDVTHAHPLTTRRAPTPPTTGRSTPTRSNAAARSAARRISDAGAAMQGVSAAQADADQRLDEVTTIAFLAAKGTSL